MFSSATNLMEYKNGNDTPCCTYIFHLFLCIKQQQIKLLLFSEACAMKMFQPGSCSPNVSLQQLRSAEVGLHYSEDRFSSGGSAGITEPDPQIPAALLDGALRMERTAAALPRLQVINYRIPSAFNNIAGNFSINI